MSVQPIHPAPTPVRSRRFARAYRKEGQPVLSVCCVLPALPSQGRGIRRIDRWYERLSALWRARWSGPLLEAAGAAADQARDEGRPFRPWSAQISLLGHWEADGILSLTWTVVEDRGGSVHTGRFGDLWRLSDGSTVSPLQLFPRKIGRRLLLEALRDGAEELSPAALRRALRESQPSLGPEGLMLWVPAGLLAPGPVLRTIPLPLNGEGPSSSG
ncbi:hypothetical protein [Pseudoflavonifractor sp. MSJ-37]|uniref:hypothetical protein n=1 Tax=Pseudoflavonifractor sp. MSJ-37 TaxID=2841531 RepID=UPI001C0F6BB8|nr:hypothetical protein [Pseudoflavonifractor sp. MSJ-37]MBU5434351.1 hypothetical protein [Pseudoflavonifractor sp. MSJ-37]